MKFQESMHGLAKASKPAPGAQPKRFFKRLWRAHLL